MPLYHIFDSYLLLAHFNIEWDSLAVLMEHVGCVSSLITVVVVEGVDYLVDLRGVLGANELGRGYRLEKGQVGGRCQRLEG